MLSLALLLASAPAALAPSGEPAEAGDAARVWLCPLHPETHHTGPGRCDVCGGARETRAIAYRWACPMHPDLDAREGGVCPACGMDPVVTTVERVWRCPLHPDRARRDPGRCPDDGATLEPGWRAMAHGDHNPRHGGIFFMAPDRHHHIEGALGADGAFRLYVYDNYTEPLDVHGFRARIGATPLVAAAGGAHLAAPLAGDPSQSPVEVTLRVDFGGGEERFDFVFTEESVPPELPELVIPTTVAGRLAALEERDVRVRALMRLGAWTQLYVPALQAKDIALTLDDPALALHVKRVVRGAWLLDVHGDLGNRPGVEDAYAVFAQGLHGLLGAAR